MANCNFPKELRLRKKKDIDNVYQNGTRISSLLIKVIIAKNRLPFSRVVISVSTKLCNAVGRNRWKRLVRAAFRLNKEKIGVGLDIIVIPLIKPESIKMQDVEKILLDLIKKYRLPT